MTDSTKGWIAKLSATVGLILLVITMAGKLLYEPNPGWANSAGYFILPFAVLTLLFARHSLKRTNIES